MQCIPIIRGYVNDKEAKKQLFEHLIHQTTSKAGEVELNLKLQDIFNQKIPGWEINRANLAQNVIKRRYKHAYLQSCHNKMDTRYKIQRI